MNKYFKLGIPVAVVAAGLSTTSATLGKPEYTKKEKKACVYCHVTAKSKELNEAGKYYKDNHHSLEGYSPKEKK